MEGKKTANPDCGWTGDLQREYLKDWKEKGRPCKKNIADFVEKMCALMQTTWRNKHI